jgi:hypothetical protein
MVSAWNSAPAPTGSPTGPAPLAADTTQLTAALHALIPALPALHAAARRWARAGATRRDLAGQLVDFVAGKL